MEWTIQDMGAAGEFVGSIAVLFTLVYLAYQTRAARHATELQMIIGASHPYPRDFEGMRKSFSRGIKAYLEEDIPNSPGLVVTDWYKTRRLANDHLALIALQQDRPDISDVISSMTMPCLMYVGEADPLYPQVKECAAHMPNARLVSFPGLGHGQAFRYSHEGLAHVRKFLADVSRQSGSVKRST